MKITRDILFISLFTITLFSLNLFAQDYNRWKLPEGAKLRIGKGIVHDIKYTPDGERVAVATSIGIWIYDARTHEELALLTGHTSWVTAIDFPADGRFLASGSFDGTVRLWDINTGKQIAVFAGHRSSVRSIAVSPNGKTLASSAWETLILWDIETGKQLKRHTKYDGVNMGQRIKNFFNRFLQGRRVKYANDTNPNVIDTLAFSPDGKTFVSGHWDGVVRIWDGETGERLSTIRDHKRNHIKSLAFSPDGKTFVSGAWVHNIQLHTFENDKYQARPIHSVSFPSNLKFSPNGILLFGTGQLIDNDTTGQKNFVHVWKVDTGRLMTSAPTPDDIRMIALAFSPNGDTILTCSWDGTFHSWDPVTLKHAIFTTGHVRVGDTLQFSPDGKILNTVVRKDKLWFFDTVTGVQISAPKEKTYSTNQKPTSSDRKISAEINKDRTAISIIDVATGTEISHITGHKDIIWRYSFSPDREMLATTSKDMTIRLWEVPTGKELLTIPAYSRWPTAITFSPDGKILAGGGVYDQNINRSSVIRVWEVPSGKVLKTLPGHIEGIKALRFSNDGKTLASSGDGTILLWDWEKISQSTR